MKAGQSTSTCAGFNPQITPIYAEKAFRAKTTKAAKKEFPFAAFAPFARPVKRKICAIQREFASKQDGYAIAFHVNCPQSSIPK